MKCSGVRARLSAYADGELSRIRHRRMDRHLRDCPNCRSVLARLGEVDQVLGQVRFRPLPEGLAARVVAEAVRWTPQADRRSLIRRLIDRITLEIRDMSVPVRLAACGTVLAASLVGFLAAGEFSAPDHRDAASMSAQTLDGLEWFGAPPPMSVAAAYVAVAQLPTAGGGGR